MGVLMAQARSKAVFLFDEPSMDKLKGCALFWKTIVVYEGFVESLVQYREPVKFVHELLKNGILKIVQTPEDLKTGLHDKIYYGLNKRLWKYLYDNSEELTIQPNLPENVEEIVQESSELDYKNGELKQLYDSIVYERTIKQWAEGAYESEYFSIAPPQVTNRVLKKMLEIAEMQYKKYQSRPEPQRYHFEYSNKLLLEQLSVSSALCIESDWAPLYRYKLGDFSIRSAKTYLDGLDIVVPLATKISIHDFSPAEILRLRSNTRWNAAMDELAELCHSARMRAKNETFKEYLTKGVLQKYQEALEEEKMTTKKLAKNLGKGAFYTGISLIPLYGSPVSAVVDKIVDPVLSFLWKHNKQENLPFFLNDMHA